MNDGGASMESVRRAINVIETIADHQPVGVSDLARRTEIPTSTVQRIVDALAGVGWLRRDDKPRTRWSLTGRALIVGRKAVGEVGLKEAAREPMAALRDATQETIHLSVADGTERMILIDRVDCDQPVRTYNRLGGTSPIHATASGRSVLAALSDADVERVIARGLERLTETTIVDPERLRTAIAEIRANGYALNIRENRAGVCAVGAAIRDASGRPVAGISISMPDIRFTPEQAAQWGAQVVKTAAEISANLDA